MRRCNATFYNLSASSLGSKYVGESEKLVKLLFDEVRVERPQPRLRGDPRRTRAVGELGIASASPQARPSSVPRYTVISI